VATPFFHKQRPRHQSLLLGRVAATSSSREGTTIFITIVDVLSRGSAEGRSRKAVDKSHHQRHNRFRRLQKQQLQSSIFSSHYTNNRALQERNTRTNRGRKEQEERKNKSRQRHSSSTVRHHLRLRLAAPGKSSLVSPLCNLINCYSSSEL